MAASEGPLSGVKVLDLSRILAGPTCTQLLGDLGARVLKIENPATGGDDTRSWGPPFARDADGADTDLSAYFLSSNRNKRSVAVDIAAPEGQAAIRRLASHADIVIENFKPGGLAQYGLDYDSLAEALPGLVYCSISGFGQTGPNRDKPGYDLMAQGFGGIMSLTGAPEGPPMKVGVGIADVMCGMYATVGILAALRHRDRTGQGQRIELALVDTQIAWLINEGVNYLTSGAPPERRGNAHPNIVPYDTLATADGHVVIAVGNDAQFARFCQVLDLPDLPRDPRFATNPARLEHRAALMRRIEPALAARPTAVVMSGLEAVKVPVGPVQTLDQVFASPQVAAREMQIDMGREGADPLRLIGNPLKFSATPVSYRRTPPHFGADTETVLNADDPFAE
ncbi:CoA transferase [Aestuariivita sp.]|uniref:CaiB/BaiF CoA transferase family protein n=1 Tax=Aestuariivita sp. TaxID=1872407 RepID=UPI002173218A|nr:CoA transferase [Aestuariivita sp.]MCE8005692.1 CoA transferase [Aestuariivita sp.]